MKFNSNWFKEIITEYSQKKAELLLDGKDAKDPEVERVSNVLDWANRIVTEIWPVKDKETKKKKLANIMIAVIELKKLGAFDKYMEV